MAKIDLKNATIRLLDGTLPFLTNTNTVGDTGKVTLTGISKHLGTNLPTLALLDAGAHAGSVVVTGRDIVVTLASDGSITETGITLKAALDGNSDAAALVTVALVSTGAGLIEAQAETPLAGNKSLTISVGDGTLSYSEKKPREFVKNRGLLDTVRNADEEPMDVSFDFIWDFLSAEAGASTPTVEEALKKTGIALSDGWVTTASDICQPYCVDIEIVSSPECSTVQDEYTIIREFYHEDLPHEAKEGTVSCSGRANTTEALHTRAA